MFPHLLLMKFRYLDKWTVMLRYSVQMVLLLNPSAQTALHGAFAMDMAQPSQPGVQQKNHSATRVLVQKSGTQSWKVYARIKSWSRN